MAETHLVDTRTGADAANVLGQFLTREAVEDLQGQEVQVGELTGDFYATTRYVFCDIPCLPSDFRIFERGNFFVVVYNQFFWIVEKQIGEDGCGVGYFVLAKYDSLQREWTAP